MFNKYSIKCMKFIQKFKKNIDNNINISSNDFVKKVLQLFNNKLENKFQYTSNVKHSIGNNIMFELFKELDYTSLKIYLTDCNIDTKYVDELKKIITANNQSEFIKWYTINGIHLQPLDYNGNNKKIKDILSAIKSDPIYDLLYWNSFLPIEIQLYIESLSLHVHNFKYKNIILNYYNISDNYDHNIINDLFKIITTYSTLINYKNNIVVNVLDLNYRKEFDGPLLFPKNINSGCCVKDTYINIWRHEEMYKVLFHELTHYFGVDIYGKSSDVIINNMLKDLFNNDCDYKFSEAYTESLAILLNCIFVIYKLKLNIDSLSDLLLYEYNFTLFQVSKLLKFYKCDNIFNTNPEVMNKYTAVYSYFIIKLLIIHNMTLFIDFISTSVNFGDRVNDMFNIIKLSLHDKKLHNNISYYYKLDDNNKYIYKTLRMTCIDLVK